MNSPTPRTPDGQFREMVLVATHYRGKELSRTTVKVKVTPKRYRIVEGLHKGDVFDRATGKYVGAFEPLSICRYRLEQKPNE